METTLLQWETKLYPYEEIYYPEEDGKPMAETDLQRDYLMYGVSALEAHYQDNPNVYVSGNLLMYYEEGNSSKCVAPDVFVVFGVPKHKRPIYKVWEEGKMADVVIEIASKTTWKKDKYHNMELYSRLGVKEYFLYDPTGDYLQPALQGYWLDEDGAYEEMELEHLAGGILKLDSMLLHLELQVEKGQLRLYDPVAQSYLNNYLEERRDKKLALQQAKQERRDKELAIQRSNQVFQRLLNTVRNLLPMFDDATISQITGLEMAVIQQLRQEN